MPRLFVALRPPPPVRDALLAVQGGVEGARWQDDDQLHLTLRYAGEVDHRAAEDLALALAGTTAPSLTLRVRGAGHFEKRGRPTALWAAVDRNPALGALQRRIEHACRACGIPAEPRRFLPHITLARLGSHAIGVGEWLARHGTLDAPLWPVSTFCLYESTLHPSGSRYTPVAEWPLRADPSATA